jgi:hypothetical protein
MTEADQLVSSTLNPWGPNPSGGEVSLKLEILMNSCLNYQPSPELVDQARMFSENYAERIASLSERNFQAASRFMEHVGQKFLPPKVVSILNESIHAADAWRFEKTLRSNRLGAGANLVYRAAYWELDTAFSFLRESVGVQYRCMSYASREQYLGFVDQSIAAFEFLMDRLNDDPSTVIA